MNYPVQSLIPALKSHLLSCNVALIHASTGSGKTTVLPLTLVNEPWLKGRKIVMLEPRRIAAKMAVWRMMDLAQGGVNVGYRVRGENSCTSHTQIEVVTEAILTRMIQDNPELNDVGLLIFDEFHERNLQADLGLALALEVKDVLRNDLRIMIMSATLDHQALLSVVPDAKSFSSEGRLYPVSIVYCGKPIGTQLISRTISAILRAYRETDGDILVFLPGIAQIKMCQAQLISLNMNTLAIHILHGSLSKEAQVEAVRKNDHLRKVIISSSIAESSLTIEGITAVVDSCLDRITQFSMGSGMDQLLTVPASLASLEQRKGRAGRLSEGICYRLISPQDERTLPIHSLPEIERCDLANLVLELAQWGCAKNPEQLKFLTIPKSTHYQHALQLLLELGALEKESYALTAIGRKMVKLPLHPRFSHVLLCAQKCKESQFSNIELVTILSENDPLKTLDADIGLRQGNRAYNDAIADMSKSMKRLGLETYMVDVSVALALAFPDRVAKQREKGGAHYLMSNGRGVKFMTDDALRYYPFIIVPHFDDKQENGIIKLACSITLEQIRKSLSFLITNHIYSYFDETKERVISVKREQLGALILSESSYRPTSEQSIPLLLDWIKKSGISRLPWSDSLMKFRQRISFLHSLPAYELEFPSLLDEDLLIDCEAWLTPVLDGKISISSITENDLRHAIESKIGYSAIRKLSVLAPEMIEVPSGSKIKIDYSNAELGPVLPVRLQELFGWFSSPKIADGKVVVTLQMLSPAMRPVQTTQDLANFWKEGYFFVRKDLRGRYPKHYWPENPLDAEAIRGSRKKLQNKS